MADVDLRKGAWAVSLAITGLLLFNGFEARESIARVIDSQERVNRSLMIHINTFQALEASIDGWDNGLRNVSEAKDLLGMYQLLNFQEFGLNTPIDKFRLVDATPYQVNDTDIGVVNVCVDSGNQELEVAAADYGSLIKGIDTMATRNDFKFDYVNIHGGDQLPTASIGNLCVLFKAIGPEAEV
jgi:hypothetical protein